jgi:hypothetical protein
MQEGEGSKHRPLGESRTSGSEVTSKASEEDLSNTTDLSISFAKLLTQFLKVLYP